jgi:hypothetical protein
MRQSSLRYWIATLAALESYTYATESQLGETGLISRLED